MSLNFILSGFSGDAHFDDDEWFTLGSAKGTNFYWVALHEFGHSIGMEHSEKLGAIMYPWYQGYKGDDVDLTDDDVKGIQELYGEIIHYRVLFIRKFLIRLNLRGKILTTKPVLTVHVIFHKF